MLLGRFQERIPYLVQSPKNISFLVKPYVVVQAKEFDCKGEENSVKVKTSPQSSDSVKVKEKSKIC